ncbi:MAG TPA: PEP-CTERM sorting domain-containing protein [Verrucomicrobiae bacterium]|nr:PEP-CTERM sorting domain-containing protein [Verrucomicrobiae bacterium]
MKTTRIIIRSLVAATVVGGLATYVHAQSLNGTLDSGFYGSPLAVQTADTGFGSGPASSGGNQLDAAYGRISSGNLYLFFAGNTSDGNFLDVFIADGRPGGQNTFNVSSGGTVNMNGSVFSPGFLATFSVNVNTFAGTMYPNAYDLTLGTGGYTGSGIPDIGGTISGAPAGNGIQLAVNESSPAGSGVNTAPGALTVTTGWEMAIPLSLLGNPSSVEVLADINGNPDNYLSNQFLPGLPNGTANVGGGGPYSGPQAGAFNFSSTPGEWFTVSVPEPSTLALFGLSGLMAMRLIRRRK